MTPEQYLAGADQAAIARALDACACRAWAGPLSVEDFAETWLETALDWREALKWECAGLQPEEAEQAIEAGLSPIEAAHGTEPAPGKVDCYACEGTGIGNPHSDSACSVCKGRGYA